MKTFQKIIGVIFLIITISASLLASDQQKNYPNIDNINKLENFSKPYILFARSTNYYKGEKGGDIGTNRGETSSLLSIPDTIENGLKIVAVDPQIIPYGSIIIHSNNIYIASDTGDAVKKRIASKTLAIKKGLSRHSKESNAPVLDFYSRNQIGNLWDEFIIIPYNGPEFKTKLKRQEKINHIRKIKQSTL